MAPKFLVNFVHLLISHFCPRVGPDLIHIWNSFSGSAVFCRNLVEQKTKAAFTDVWPFSTAQSQVTREDKSYRSLAILSVQAVEDKVTVTCLVQHPALYAAAQPLVDFVHIRTNSEYVS